MSRALIFSEVSIVAMLDGRKNQTRRLIKGGELWSGCFTGDCPHERQQECDAALREFNPYGKPGDLIWVKERALRMFAPTGKYGKDAGFIYLADYDHEPSLISRDSALKSWDWPSALFMPKAASRLTLRIVDVRAERVQKISKADVIAEGITERDGQPIADCVAGWHEPYAELFEEINGAGSWGRNPWVWKLTYEVIHSNIDQVKGGPTP